ncbi:hypothetical protein DPMN_133598 [Dreissena polymorpha]|uniref:C1q domain-containing protein n=1 Tax=Dreissena polymorpha TaxID=45954 RepID=A0A9D4FUK3_DREPO|nr:hypothetical protein DPMN_133598 [Dreissena polymorpha]
MGQTSKELEILREGSVVPLIMFHARLQHSGTTFTYATNEDVKFNTVLVNEGGVYDPVTGHFTASVAGVYMFTVQYCPISGQKAYFEIVHEDKPVQRSRQGDPSYYLCVTMQVFAKISIGDNVWVRCTSSSAVYQNDVYYWNSFSGLLIRA